MNDKSLPILFTDLVAAFAAVLGIFFALKIFQVPNCTDIQREAIFRWVPLVSAALTAGFIFELLIGIRKDSLPSKYIGYSCAFALILTWAIYKWKLNAISMAAC